MKIQYYTRILHAKNLTINTTLSYNIQYIYYYEVDKKSFSHISPSLVFRS